MSNIIQLDPLRKKKLGEKGFRLWNAQFKQSFDENTRLADLPDKVLLFLASPGEKSTGAIYDLIERIRYPHWKYSNPEDEKKREMNLIDIHLYLLDHIRLEMMRRLDWLEEYGGMDTPILDLILDFDKSHPAFATPPQLAKDHPQIGEYLELIPKEQEVFIRKLAVSALIEFNHKLNG